MLFLFMQYVMGAGYPSSTDRSVHKFFTKILALTS